MHKIQIYHGYYVDLYKSPNGNLEITPTDKFFEEINDFANMSNQEVIQEVLDYHLRNGWSIIQSEELGALTDGEIISDDFEYDNNDSLIKCDYVYWNSNYQIEDFFETLKHNKKVIWTGCKIDS